MLAAAACVPLSEAINSRDLECGEVPEDTCITIADHFVTPVSYTHLRAHET